MINAKYYVYIWKIAETGEVFYVGKGSGNRAYSMKDRNPRFKNIRKKHNCICEIVKRFEMEKDAYDYELELGKYYKSIGQAKACYVLGKDDKFISKDTKEKIRGTLKAKHQKPWNYGMKMDDEYRKKLSESHKGKTQTPETKEKRSQSLKGHAVSQKTIDSLLERRRKSVLVFNDIEILEFDSATDAAKHFSISVATASIRCSKNKTIKGYTWSYKHGNTEGAET